MSFTETLEVLGGIIGIVASFLGIIQFTITYKREIDSWIESAKLPSEVNFYFLLLWGLVASSVGGILWIIVNRLNEIYHFMGSSPYSGGNQSEPHGTAAILWPAITITPLIITIFLLNGRYAFTKVSEQHLLSMLLLNRSTYNKGFNTVLMLLAFLLGATVGSILFYDIPIFSSIGFRNYFDSRQTPYLIKEFFLVLIWSFLLSMLGFLFAYIAHRLLTPQSINPIRVSTLIKQVGLCVGLTTLAVALCLLFPDRERFDTARGIVAGLVLRTTLFFGLLIGIDVIEPSNWLGMDVRRIRKS
jgi:hypothetical protein